MRAFLIATSAFLLSGCFATGFDFSKPEMPQQWTSYEKTIIAETEVQNLRLWWQKFNDPTLNQLIDLSLKDSPDRLMAEARILEARGLRRTSRSNLFPQIGAFGNIGQQDNGLNPSDDYYDAGFDASFELDIFGKNRKNLEAYELQIEALQAQYNDTSLTLISETARSYIEYRGFEKQAAIALKNLEIQEQTLELIRNQKEYGEAPQLDVERAENLVNTTKASIPAFQRLADNARLQLTVLTGALPENILPLLGTEGVVPGSDVTPVLLAPADVLSLRPDIRVATSNLKAQTKLAESITAELLPSFTIGGLFGVADSALINSATVWNIFAGAAVSLIDFGRVEGRIDAARAREKQAYQQYRRTFLSAIAELETALSDYAHINEQRVSLNMAYNNANQALTLSQMLYREGEISFLDILDAQRTLNGAESALITAQVEQSTSLIRLYKSLGVY